MSETPYLPVRAKLTPEDVLANHQPSDGEPNVCPSCTRMGVSGQNVKTAYPCAPVLFAREAIRRRDLTA